MNYELNDVNVNYINVFIDGLVTSFRKKNEDAFTLDIYCLKNFNNEQDESFNYLVDRLNDKNITVNIKPTEEKVSSIHVEYYNCTTCINKKSFDFQISNLTEIINLSVRVGLSIKCIILMKLIAKFIYQQKILYKAVVIDLDDTIWPGTLAEEGIDQIKQNLRLSKNYKFIKFMYFLRTLAENLGIFLAICSKNDSRQVEEAINHLEDDIFPLKDQIDCIVANFNDKSSNIKEIAEQLHITPGAIVFIDDSEIIREEVSSSIPDVFVLNWHDHDELINLLEAGCFFESFELSVRSQNRRPILRILNIDRTKNKLPNYSVKAEIDIDHNKSIELYKRSNQFNLNASSMLDSPDKSISIVFNITIKDVSEICSALTYSENNDEIIICNWVLSCRYFGIGVEEFVLLYILNKLKNGRKVFLNYSKSNSNQKVSEMIFKYSNMFFPRDEDNLIEFSPNEDGVNQLQSNTKLELI